MDKYVPTTQVVKSAYVKFLRNAFVASTSELEQEFDRWLDAVRAQAITEAADAG